MKHPSTSPRVESPPETRRAALLKLLEDEDPAIYRTVRGTILGYGPEVATWLRPHALSGNPFVRRRVGEILRHFDRQAADDAFLAFCLRQGEELDLEQGALLLGSTRYPGINLEAYEALIDTFARTLKQRLHPRAKPLTILTRVNHYVFEELNFTGNGRDLDNPQNSYLNRVIDRRTGSPVSLSVFYLLLARRVGLPVAGIGLPGHFICRYQTTSAEIYLDVFHKGRLLTKADCVQYLVRGSFSLRDEHLSPVSPRRVLLRLCADLHQVYVRRKDKEEALRLQRYLVALAR